MSKILESLPLTVVAGVVLTIIMAVVTDRMTAPPSMSDAMDAAKSQLEDMTQ